MLTDQHPYLIYSGTKVIKPVLKQIPIQVSHHHVYYVYFPILASRFNIASLQWSSHFMTAPSPQKDYTNVACVLIQKDIRLTEVKSVTG